MKTTDHISSSQTPLGAMPKDPRARLKKAAEAMEAIWLTQMLREARPKGGLLDKSFAAQTFRDMLDQAMGESMATSGVIGLSSTLVCQFLGPEQQMPSLEETQAAKLQKNIPAPGTNAEEPKVHDTRGTEP
jgi:Rod binding domain-containing protein